MLQLCDISVITVSGFLSRRHIVVVTLAMLHVGRSLKHLSLTIDQRCFCFLSLREGVPRAPGQCRATVCGNHEDISLSK